MSEFLKQTMANLEREEKHVVECFDNGNLIAGSLREHVYNIKRHGLFKAAGYDSFKQYCESGRITFGKKRIALKYDQLGKLAVNGEIEQHLPKNDVSFFSDRALTTLATIRVEIKDDVTGDVIKKTHDLDLKKIRAVVKMVLDARERAIAKDPEVNGQITGPIVKQAIEKKYGPNPPKKLYELMKIEQMRATRFLASLEAITELDGGEFLFSDAEEESPGCAKLLAAAYSKIASFLRKV